MKPLLTFLQKNNRIIFIILLLLTLIPGVSPAVALFAGLAFALTAGQPFPKFSKKCSKYLLQISVVGLGFRNELTRISQSGKRRYDVHHHFRSYGYDPGLSYRTETASKQKDIISYLIGNGHLRWQCYRSRSSST